MQKNQYLLQPFILHYDDKNYLKSTPNNSCLSYITIISNVLVLEEENEKIKVSKIATIETNGENTDTFDSEIETTKDFLFDDYYSALRGMAFVCASYKIHEKDIFSITCSLMNQKEYNNFLKDFYKNNPEIFI